jgi:hypothetical protein
MWEFLKKLTDTSNTYSSNRYAFLFTTIISNVIFWILWAAISVYLGKLAEVPTGVYVIYGLANGIVGLGKFGQNIAEIKAEPKQ